MLIFTEFIEYVMGGWPHIGKAAGIATGIFFISWLVFTITNEGVDADNYTSPKMNGFTCFTYMVSITGLVFTLSVCGAASINQLQKDIRETNRQMQKAAEKSINKVFPEDARESLKDFEKETGISFKDFISEPEKKTF